MTPPYPCTPADRASVALTFIDCLFNCLCNFSIAAIRRATSLLFATVVLAAVTLVPIATAGAAVNVSAVHAHGALQAYDVPSSYGVFRGALFFSSADKLLRLDSIEHSAVQLPLADAMGNGLALRARFTVFDGALFMHARRRSRGNNGYFLHRIDNRHATTIELIDIAEEPSTPQFDWIVERGYPDDSREFAELDGKLYFFAARAIRPLDFTNLSHALYRLDSADSTPQQVLWEDYFNAVNPRDLAATSLGIVFRATSPGVARQGHLPQSYIYRIDDPIAVDDAATGYRDFSVASAKRISGRTGGRELIVFDDMIYYAGEHHGLRLNDSFPDAGPFPDPGRVKNSADPWQTELYRHDPSSGNVYFDLHAIDDEMANRALNLGQKNIGSSSPDSFVHATGAFYFRARANGVNAEIYRLRPGDTRPQQLTLNATAASEARPVGEFSGRLWFAADIGNGFDLHYLSNDGQTPVALNVGESVARSSRGFTEYGDHVVFTGRGDDGQWWTYAATIGTPTVQPASEVLSTTLMVNNSNAAKIDVTVDDPIQFNCSVTNMTTAALDNIRVVVRQNEALSFPANTVSDSDGQGKASRAIRSRASYSVCKKNRLGSGRSVNCRLAIRAEEGEYRYACIGSITSGVDTRIRSRARTIITGYAGARDNK